jgi:putative FmdB family regulatory protein
MPLYEYECDACGGRFEVIQKFSETTETCRRCGKGPVRRLLSPPAIQFKGTGWYITDYAQKGKSGGDTPAAGDAPAEKKPDAAKAETSTKSDTAPAPSAAPSTTSSKD